MLQKLVLGVKLATIIKILLVKEILNQQCGEFLEMVFRWYFHDFIIPLILEGQGIGIRSGIFRTFLKDCGEFQFSRSLL